MNGAPGHGNALETNCDFRIILGLENAAAGPQKMKVPRRKFSWLERGKPGSG
jgi:hypothetical protein